MLPALIVGGYTAWFMGMRTGALAGGLVAVALLAANFLPIPGITLVVYALITGWCAALFFFGRQMGAKPGGTQSYKASVMSDIGSLAARARRLIKR